MVTSQLSRGMKVNGFCTDQRVEWWQRWRQSCSEQWRSFLLQQRWRGNRSTSRRGRGNLPNHIRMVLNCISVNASVRICQKVQWSTTDSTNTDKHMTLMRHLCYYDAYIIMLLAVLSFLKKKKSSSLLNTLSYCI